MACKWSLKTAKLQPSAYSVTSEGDSSHSHDTLCPASVNIQREGDFPGPWHSRPSYDTRLQILDIPTTISRFDYLRTMFVVGCFWSKYDISWEDYIKVNTSNSRQAVNIDFRHFRSRTDAFHNSLFVSFPRIWSTLPADVSSEIVLNLFSYSLHRCVYIYH